MEQINLVQPEEFEKTLKVLSEFFRRTEDLTALLRAGCRLDKKEDDPNN